MSLNLSVMDVANDNVIGIVGGMGPEAGMALFNSILTHTRATTDQEHLSVLLMSFPRHITDRTSFLQGVEEINPAYNVSDMICRLECAGARVVGLACNTVHVPEIFDVIAEELRKKNSQVRLLNMPAETCRYIRRHHAQVHRVGLMTTNGTYRSALYENLLLDFGLHAIVPDAVFQNDVVHRMIYDKRVGIKANPGRITPEVKLLAAEAIEFFRQHQAEAIILGCTELSLLKQEMSRDFVIIDSTEALALALIREATVALAQAPQF